MNKKATILTIAAITVATLFSTGVLHAKGYKIEIKINGISNADVILGHYIDQEMYPNDTATLTNDGYGVFEGDKPLDHGMYIVFVPGPKWFDILISGDQHFLLETDTSDFVKLTKFEGSTENKLFFEYKRYMNSMNAEIQNLKEKHAGNEEKLKNGMDKINAQRKEKIANYKTGYPEFFLGTFLNATLDIEVPQPPRDVDGNLIDSAWAYKYYRKHYFDNFDYTDTRLLRTPLYGSKVTNYFNKVIPQIPDTIIAEIDRFIANVEHDSALFRYNLISFFNHYGQSKIMGMETVQVHIAEKYYIVKAWWSSRKYISDLKERIEAMKPTLIGKTAPNIQLRYVPAGHFKKALETDTLKKYPHAGANFNIGDIEADYTVLFFWEATCSHCKHSVPDMYQLYTTKLKDMQVKIIAINNMGGIEGKEKWTDFVNKYKLYDWINAWQPYSYEYKLTYDIRSTPQIFILDKEKKIIAKRIGEDQVLDIITTHKKYSNKKH